MNTNMNQILPQQANVVQMIVDNTGVAQRQQMSDIVTNSQQTQSGPSQPPQPTPNQLPQSLLSKPLQPAVSQPSKNGQKPKGPKLTPKNMAAINEAQAAESYISSPSPGNVRLAFFCDASMSTIHNNQHLYLPGGLGVVFCRYAPRTYMNGDIVSMGFAVGAIIDNNLGEGLAIL
ncbi:hypothetical protein B0T26DRAFT_756744 [Lasiosphaeria miniovina]|uniref:Uncharacterized protein n=1 Tax=Lasiosphaeria miniovina TaxID=1954250 RepID=A0AA40DJM7_9PEZI|nr:uncharacterized protein B0T26DRAFT_756744 [Lasiosphaeria miniovina]KAK0703177.1 hypothetical protein B0T26DRAFT_756744 [Lasiosphaeria miniovina]